MFHVADEGDEVVHYELTDDIEKKARTMCCPMDQLLGQLLSNEINYYRCLATSKLKKYKKSL